jgi:D-glycero-D-manno-heptose 1,7-bisphosphate phosphatase
MIKEAVILCGGYGTRLGSLTKNNSKAMVIVTGKPFLEHLIIQLKKNGIKIIFLLVGFKKEKIINYFGDGEKWGVKIYYSYNPPDCETGLRIFHIKNKIRSNFLILYCDNYSPFNLDKVFKIFKKKKSLITLTVARKKRGNIKFIKNSNIIYSIKKSFSNNHVEIGYMLANKKILKFLDNKNLSLSFYLKKISLKNKVSAYETPNSYLSISDPERLKKTRKIFRNKKIILVDRDGVLNKKNKKFFYVRNTKELLFNDKILSVLKKFPNYKFICITNQAGIATGQVSKKNLAMVNSTIKKYLKKNRINLIKYYVSEDHYKSKSFYRKPNPGNFIKASNEYNFLLDKTFYIGDDIRDVEAAYNANTKCFFLNNKINIKKKFNNIIRGSLYSALQNYI